MHEAQCISWLPCNIFAFIDIQYESVSEELSMDKYICITVHSTPMYLSNYYSDNSNEHLSNDQILAKFLMTINLKHGIGK